MSLEVFPVSGNFRNKTASKQPNCYLNNNKFDMYICIVQQDIKGSSKRAVDLEVNVNARNNL